MNSSASGIERDVVQNIYKVSSPFITLIAEKAIATNNGNFFTGRAESTKERQTLLKNVFIHKLSLSTCTVDL